MDSPEDLLENLANNVKQRRLEKGLSRKALSVISGVSYATIAKYEITKKISLESFVKIAKALGYSKSIKNLLAEPIYHSVEELDFINKNKNRKHGRNVLNR